MYCYGPKPPYIRIWSSCIAMAVSTNMDGGTISMRRFPDGVVLEDSHHEALVLINVIILWSVDPLALLIFFNL